MAQEKKTKLGVWVILGLIFVSLIGFGGTSLTSTSNTLATVGEKEITVNQYALEMQRGLDAISRQLGTPISFAQAQAAGLDQEILGELVNNRILQNEVANLGISAGDERLATIIRNDPNFQGLSGQFERDTYAEILRRWGTREADFENVVRDEISATALQVGLVTGFDAPADYVDLLTNYVAERRDISWVRFDATAVETPVAEPTDAELAEYLEQNPADFTTPETKSIVYAALTPDMLLPTIDVDETAIRELYDARSADYNREERRLVERLGFGDDAAAQAALDAITAGETDFDTLVADRGLTLDDVDLGDVALSDLEAAGQAVFAAQTGDVVGPLPSLIGPALFRVNAILDAEEISFEQASDELRLELGRDRARRVIQDTAEQMADLIAGGARVEDLAANTNMELNTMNWTAESTDGMAAYPEFRNAAAAAEIGAYPELFQTSDGGMFVLRVEQVNEPAVQALEDVRDAVAAAWAVDAQQKAVIAYAEDQAAALTDGATFADLGIEATVDADVTRQTFLDFTPQGFMAQVFASDEGAAFVMPYDNGAVLAQVTAIKSPADDEDTAAIRDRIAEQLSNSMAQDVFATTLSRIAADTEINVVQAAVTAVNAQMQ